MTKLKNNYLTSQSEAKKKRQFPVNISFRQFRHYLEVLKEGGEELLREAVEREEEYQEQLSVASSSGRSSRLHRLRSRDASIVDYELSPAARDKGTDSALSFNFEENERPQRLERKQRLSVVSNPAKKTSVNQRSRKISVFEMPTGLIEPANRELVDDDKKACNEYKDSTDKDSLLKEQTSPLPATIKTQRPSRNSKYKNELDVSISEQPEQVNTREKPLLPILEITSPGDTPKLSQSRSKVGLKVRKSASPKSKRIYDMRTRAMERYLEGIAEKEEAFITLRNQDQLFKPRLQQRSAEETASEAISQGAVPRYLALYNLRAAHELTKAESASSTRSGSYSAPVLPLSWSRRLTQEDVKEVYYQGVEDTTNKVTTNKSTTNSTSNRSRVNSDKQSVSNSSRRSSLYRQEAPVAVPSNGTNRQRANTGPTSTDTRRASVRRNSLLQLDVDASSSVVSTNTSRRGSVSLDHGRAKSAGSRHSVCTTTTTGTGSGRAKSEKGLSRTGGGAGSGAAAAAAGAGGGAGEQPRKRTRLVYRADPPIPLRIYITQKEPVHEKFVDGIVDEQGLPLLPASRRHIMTGLVYQKLSRSLIPPRPAEYRVPRISPSVASSSASMRSTGSTLSQFYN